MREAMPNSGARFLVLIARTGRTARLLMLLGVSAALGACSKCDVPDLGHWGSPPPSRLPRRSTAAVDRRLICSNTWGGDFRHSLPRGSETLDGGPLSDSLSSGNSPSSPTDASMEA